VKIAILDYEIMCKQTVDFCNCETGSIEISDVEAAANVLNEVYITRTVTKEVYVEDDELLNIEDESN